MARQELFEWDQDASKTHLMSTSQDFNRHSITEHSSIMPSDWASVVEPFVQRRSLESNTDSAPQSPFNSDFIGNLQKPNLFTESARKIDRLKQSDGRSQKITRGVIKLSFIVNQRYTYSLYKLRTLRQPVSMPRLPTSLQTISDTSNHTNTFTFTSYFPQSLSTIKTQIYSKKSLKPMSVIQFVERLKRAIVRQPFKTIQNAEKTNERMSKQKISFDMVNSSLKKQSGMSRGWKKPSSILQYQPFYNNMPQVNIKEQHIQQARTSKLDITPSRVANVIPDIKDPIMEDEVQSSVSIPAPLPASEIQQLTQPSQVTENNNFSRMQHHSQPSMVRQRPTTEYQNIAMNQYTPTANIPSLATIKPQSQHTQVLYTARPVTARPHSRGLSLEQVMQRVGQSPQGRRFQGFRPLSPKSPVSPLSSVNPALFIAQPFRSDRDWRSAPKPINIVQQKIPSSHGIHTLQMRQIPRNTSPNHYFVSPIQFNRQNQPQFVNQYGLVRQPQQNRPLFRQF